LQDVVKRLDVLEEEVSRLRIEIIRHDDSVIEWVMIEIASDITRLDSAQAGQKKPPIPKDQRP
jgi:hypothetical protein